MIRVSVEVPGRTVCVTDCLSPVVVGRGPDVDVEVSSWRAARRHAVIRERRGTLWVSDLETWCGTQINGHRIVAETPLGEHDVITVVTVKLTARCLPEHASGDARSGAPAGMAADGSDTQPSEPPWMACSPTEGLSLSSEPGCAPTALTDGSPVHTADNHAGAHPVTGQTAGIAPDRQMLALQASLQRELLNALDLRREDVATMSDAHLRVRATDLLTDILDRMVPDCPADRRHAMLRAALDEAVGLGPLEPLLADDTVSEIMVNRFDEIYVERGGRLARCNAVFTDNASVLAVIERIVSSIGRRVDESSPMVDARLPDGSRVNAIIAPLALKGPALTIRKFARKRLTMVDLVRMRSLHAHMASFLDACVKGRKNIIVSGGTGSGKTTLLNILSGLIAANERIITIEDAAELQLPHDHVVSLEARPANVEGRGRVDIRDLVRNALRMRPDRIVVGECRGAEAFDMLAAMNTGHEGSLTTLHANTPRDALARLETMILMAGMDLPLQAVREHIVSGIDLVVQQVRLEDGHRVITEIAEVAGMESGAILLQPLYRRERAGGTWTGCGVLPTFADAWRLAGRALDPTWFDLDSPAGLRSRNHADEGRS